MKLWNEYARWRRGEAKTDGLLRLLDGWERLLKATTDLLALHADYSQWESFERLEAIHPIVNPGFPEVLRDNADNGERFPFEGMETAKCSNCKQCTSGLCGALDFIESAKEDEESAESCPFYIPDEEEAENQRKNPESYTFYTGD